MEFEGGDGMSELNSALFREAETQQLKERPEQGGKCRHLSYGKKFLIKECGNN